MKQRERRKENDAGMLAQSCYAGVASGDGRHLHTDPNQELVLDDGSAIRFATVLRTASAPLREGRCATTGQSSCPNSVGPHRTLVHCVRSKLLPTSPRAICPWTPRRDRVPVRDPGFAALLSLFFLRPWTLSLNPSAVRGQRWFPGICRPSLSFPTDQELCSWTSR